MECLISVILYQQNYSSIEKEYSELLFLTKNSSLLKNRHFSSCHGNRMEQR